MIGSAPPRTLRAGVGDLVSNLTALMDWRRADELGHGPLRRLLGHDRRAARRGRCWTSSDLDRPPSHELMAKGLLMSGLAMAAAGHQPAVLGRRAPDQPQPGRAAGRAGRHARRAGRAGRAGGGRGARLAAAGRRSMAFFARLGAALPARASWASPATSCADAIAGAPATRPDRYTILTDVLERDGRACPRCSSARSQRPPRRWRRGSPGSPGCGSSRRRSAPIRDDVVLFESWRGQYSDNPRAISEELHGRDTRPPPRLGASTRRWSPRCRTGSSRWPRAATRTWR